MTRLVLRLDTIAQATNSLHLAFSVGDLRFSTAYWYEGVDFPDLRARFGVDVIERICFHIAAFELNKLASLKPDVVDFGAYRRHQTPEFETLWRTVFRHVWAQWRYENDLPDYHGPALQPASGVCGGAPTAVGRRDDAPVLSFCGGGKDSLVAMKLLERGRIPFDSLTYSSSIYGTAAQQHQMIGRLLDHAAPRRRNRQWVYDDFLDSPVLDLRRDFGVTTVTAAETPSSLFASLPLVLQHGYRYLAVGHERSADTGQVYWPATGEDVNHQWGKSYEAECLLNGYIRSQLIEDVHVFSILKPLYDVLIFSLLQDDLDAVAATHSCNVRKPWCRRCPKCAYVWLGYRAFLPPEVVAATFGDENLFDVEENQFIFRSLLGLESHLPFECVGQAGETRLFFEMCRRRGHAGKAMQAFVRDAERPALEALADRYLALDWARSAVPAHVRSAIEPRLTQAATQAKRDILAL